jgi:hypothetical protein
LPGINSGAIHLLNAEYITQDKLLRDPLASSKSAYPRLLSRRLAKEEPTAHAGLSQWQQQRRISAAIWAVFPPSQFSWSMPFPVAGPIV